MPAMIHRFIDYISRELSYSDHTVEAYRRDLSQWADWATSGHPAELRPSDVTTDDLRLWVATLSRQGNSVITVRRKVQSLRRFFRWMMAYHGLDRNPAADLQLARKPKPLPVYVRPEETRTLLASDPDAADFASLRDHLMLELLYTTGMRCSELITLKDSQTDTRRCELKVLGKRNKERLIPFGQTLAQTIDRYRAARDSQPQTAVSPRDTAAPLLVRDNGQPLYRKMVYNTVHRAMEMAGVHATRLSPHVMRHSCATDLLNAGASLPTVQRLLGHASLESTQIYTHVTYRELQQNYQTAHPRALKKGGQNGH